MKVTANSYLNARTNQASTKMPNPFFVQPGDIIEIDDVLCGEEIEGNCIWYHGTDGNFYWSGGVENTNFLLEKKTFDSLGSNDQMNFIASLKNDMLNQWQNRPDIIGYGAGRKNNATGGAACLVVYVDVKLAANDPKSAVPPSIQYKGYNIPTDVVAIKRFETHQYNPNNKANSFTLKAEQGTPIYCGGKISPVGSAVYGTRTLKVLYNNETCLLTCFHVMLPGEVKDEQRLFFNGELPRNGVFPNGRDTLKVVRGVYDEKFDFSLLKIDDVLLKNVYWQLPVPLHESPIRDFYKPDEIIQGMQVTCFGATSGPQTGVIESVRVDADIVMNEVKRHYKDIIITDKISEPGDSGAPVVGPDNRLIGYIVGGTDPSVPDSEAKSVVIPWHRIPGSQLIQIAKS